MLGRRSPSICLALFWRYGVSFGALFGKPLPKEALRLGAGDEAKASSGQSDRETNATQAFEAGAVHLLFLLQKEGRLIDFLQESIEGYDDAQVGSRRAHDP